MSDANWIPGMSQIKTTFQLAGDKVDATITTENHHPKYPGVSTSFPQLGYKNKETFNVANGVYLSRPMLVNTIQLRDDIGVIPNERLISLSNSDAGRTDKWCNLVLEKKM